MCSIWSCFLNKLVSKDESLSTELRVLVGSNRFGRLVVKYVNYVSKAYFVGPRYNEKQFPITSTLLMLGRDTVDDKKLQEGFWL